MNTRRLLAGCVAAVLGVGRVAAADTVDQRVDAIMGKLTADDEVRLLAGVDDFYTRDVPAAGLPRFKFTDGPVGTRNDGKTTAYPAGVLLAATWDPAMAEREGVALGRDARCRGDNVLLGPGVNICREPQNGRNFEYFGEDPYLAGKMAVGYIRGVQSQGVAACVKHFACNNQETNRTTVDAKVDERTLHEIYLPAFEAAVKDGHVRAVMCSYNRLNGEYASANHTLLTDVLRTEWGFDGLAMSDWGAVHDTAGPMAAGLDLEMPDPHWLNAKRLKPLMDAGTVTPAMIDRKVRRLVRVAVEMGWLDRPQKDPAIAKDDDANAATALAVARAGIVLLKNDGGVLPLDRAKVKTIVVLGPGAGEYVAGGGSSYTQPARPVTVAQGLAAVGGDAVDVVAIPYKAWDDRRIAAAAKASAYEPAADGTAGLTAAFYNNNTLSGEPVLTRTDKAVSFDWKRKHPVPGVSGEPFSIRWTGTIKPATSGKYTFATRSDDGSRVLLDGKLVVDNWRDQQAHTESAEVDLVAGRTYPLTVEYYNTAGEASVAFAYQLTATELTPAQREQVAKADAAVVCVRTYESEGGDRPFGLEGAQRQLLGDVGKLNRRTVVVLNAGADLGVGQWADDAAAVVDAFYAGQSGGTAVAEVLFGDVNPSGHLPDTFGPDWPQAAAFGHYPGDKTVEYAEGLLVGYRWFDAKKIEPRFPFGFGLSYTTFAVKNVAAKATGERAFAVTADVTNTGPRAGAAVVQLYVRPPAGADGPPQALKGFDKVALQPGETRVVTLPLDERAFAHWDVGTHGWVVTPGAYTAAVGQSSRAIDGTATVDVK